MTIFQASFTKLAWAGPRPAQSVTGGTGQKSDHLRAIQGIFKPLIFLGLWVRESCPGPYWGRRPWNDFSLVCFCHCSMCPCTPEPIDKCTWGSYLCKVDLHCCWEKRKGRGKRVTPISALALLWRIWSLFPEQRDEGTSIPQPSHWERSPCSLSVSGGMPSSQWSSYPHTCQGQAAGGGN